MRIERFFIIMAACLLLFGVFEAVGTFWKGGAPNAARPAMVAVFVGGFVGCWGLMLWRRRVRIQNDVMQNGGALQNETAQHDSTAE